MRHFPPFHGLVLGLFLLGSGAPLRAQAPASAAPGGDLVTGIPAVASKTGLAAIPAESGAAFPLASLPYVYSLDLRDASQMTPEDAAHVASAQGELSRQAALAGFNLADAGWQYRQVVCPAFPDYLILDYFHGPDPNGSSRFVVSMARDGSGAGIVTTSAHGARSFDTAWSKSGTREVLNRMLSRERGSHSLSSAPNWLVIGMCFAELSGHHVQVLTHRNTVDGSLDMYRLSGNQPQFLIAPNHQTEIDFSDVSRPGFTTQWALSFDRHGQISAVTQSSVRQPARIALKPAALDPTPPQ